MAMHDLKKIYRAYIDCLNRQDWANLGNFVHEEALHNGKAIGRSGYQKMLERDFLEIPDLRFTIEVLISDPPYIASILRFDCHPAGKFLGLDVNGQRVRFTENVFYEFQDDTIKSVHSIVDKAAIERQLTGTAMPPDQLAGLSHKAPSEDAF